LDGGLGSLEDAGEFPAGDDVEPSTVFSQQTHEGERGVRFEGVADGVGDRGKCVLEELESRHDVLLGVDVERGAVGLGQVGEGNTVAVKLTISIGEGTGVWGGLKLCFGNRTVLDAGYAGILMMPHSPHRRLGLGANCMVLSGDGCLMFWRETIMVL